MTSSLVIATAFLTSVSCAMAQTERVIYSFDGVPDGAYPWGSLIEHGQGSFYGTAIEGGGFNCGTVFELKRDSSAVSMSVIWAFGNAGASDGCNPNAGVIVDAAGNLYGTTYGGGSEGYGTAFELSPDGTGGWAEKIMWNFGAVNGNVQDGLTPTAGLAMDPAGNLYGTTLYGTGDACGTVFELSPNGDGNWSEAVLHTFDSCGGGPDGLQPFAGVTLDSAGNIYGTTAQGGSSGCGTVFALEKASGWKENQIYIFKCGNDGELSETPVIFTKAGHLLGTASEGGDFAGGVAFELVKTASGWQQTVLHAFGSVPNDGVHPNSGLTARGNHYYGATMGLPSELYSNCGYYTCGIVYELTQTAAGWSYSILHSFVNPDDGTFDGWYGDGLTETEDGHIYGATGAGGTHGLGTVFEITP
jgi:uncharacterized repeat protein (TIGR03803 family)